MIYNLISDIRKNISIKDIIIILLIIYLLYRLNVVENMTDTTNENIRDTIKDVYQVDVQAIKNLGDVAKVLLNPEKTDLILPYNVKIEGKFETTGDIKSAGDIKSTGANISLVDEEGRDRFRIHETQGNSYIDSRGSLNLRDASDVGRRTNVNTGNVESTGEIKGKISGTGTEALLPGFRFTTAGNDAYIQTNKTGGIIFSKVGTGDEINIRAQNISAIDAVSAGNGAISMNPNTYGKAGIYAPGGINIGDSLYVGGNINSGGVVEGNQVKANDKIILQNKWFNWRNSNNNDSCFVYDGKSSGGTGLNC